jgi:hypothetical protein
VVGAAVVGAAVVGAAVVGAAVVGAAVVGAVVVGDGDGVGAGGCGTARKMSTASKIGTVLSEHQPFEKLTAPKQLQSLNQTICKPSLAPATHR